VEETNQAMAIHLQRAVDSFDIYWELRQKEKPKKNSKRNNPPPEPPNPKTDPPPKTKEKSNTFQGKRVRVIGVIRQ